VRSSSTLRRLVALADREMADASDERDRIVADLSAGNAAHAELTKLAHSLAAAEVRVARAEERWLALAEELGG
jgi:hypothetical protein